MTESTIYPVEIEIDTIKGGIARLLCHWNIESTIFEDTILYRYDEAVIKWSLPETYTSEGQTITITSREDVENYITANASEIMSYAKATKIMM